MTFTAGLITGVICTFLFSGLVLMLMLLSARHHRSTQAMEQLFNDMEASRRDGMAKALLTADGPTRLNAGTDISCVVIDEGGRLPEQRWKVGDEVRWVQVDGGYVYMSPEAYERYKPLIPKLNQDGPWHA